MQSTQLGQIATELVSAFHSNPLLIGGLILVLLLSFVPPIGSFVGNLAASILGRSGEPARWGVATLVCIVLPIVVVGLLLSIYAKVELAPLLNMGS